MPLTDVNQSGYDWHKHPHTKILLNARIRTLKPAHKGMLWMLMEYAALEVPFGSLENDAERLAEMAGVSLSVWSKSSDAVMGAAFVLCSDNRWYCQLLTDMLSSNVKQTDQDEPKQRSKSAERVARLRDRQRNAVTPDVTHPSVTGNADVTHDLTPVTHDVTPVTVTSVTSVTNGGIKGGDLDQDSDLDLELKQKHTSAESSAARVSAFKTELSEVFEHWKFVFKKNAATKLDDKRKTKIVARLKDGYTVDQIKQAINGCAASEYHVQNHHTDIELICRDAVHTDRFIGMSPVTKKPSPSNPNPGAVNEKWPESKVTIPPTPETIAALKKMQDELEC